MTRFESMEVIANNDTDAGFAVDDHVVSPGGVYARSKDGVLRAGVFTSYNGVTLSPGDHWIIEERDARGVRVTKPADEDSLIVIAPLEGWDEQTPIEVRAYGTDARLIRTVNFTRVAQGLLFFYSRAVDQQLVDHYLIVDGSRPPRTRGVRR